MTIEITRPEVEALIQQRMQSGAFASAEDVILQALRSFNPGHPTGANLVAAMQASPYREIDIEPTRDRLPVRDVTFLMAWLLVTKILSELRWPKREPNVVAFVAAQPLEHSISARSLS